MTPKQTRALISAAVLFYFLAFVAVWLLTGCSGLTTVENASLAQDIAEAVGEYSDPGSTEAVLAAAVSAAAAALLGGGAVHRHHKKKNGPENVSSE